MAITEPPDDAPDPDPCPTASEEEEEVTLTIPDAWDRQRLDKVVSALLPRVGRSLVQRLIPAGRLLVDSRPARSPSDKARSGQRVVLRIPAPRPVVTRAEPLPLVILHEDPHLAVVDKPAGMAVHPGAGVTSGTLVNALLHHCDDLSGIGGELRPGIVHRLDKETSGVLVIAKHDAAHRALAAQFHDHTAFRRYLAVVKGHPHPPRGTIDAPIARHPVHRQRMAVVANGRRAVTHYEVLERLGPFALVSCRLETGRTHQIRVHLAHLRHPLLGDPVYARPFVPPAAWPDQVREAVLGFRRQALHARELTFTHPVSGQRVTFRSDPPPDLAALLAALRRLPPTP